MLTPVVIRAPGFGGLNLEGEDVVADARFAKEALNLVFDNAGRLASRKGYRPTADLSGTDPVDAIFVYNNSSAPVLIAATADHIYQDTIPSGTPADVQGALTHTTAHWQFQNFNDKVVGAQQGQTPIVWAGTSNFAAIAPKGGGSVDPDGNCIHSAFGRLWASDADGTTVYYSGLLDETEWPSATTPGDSGSINILGNEAAVRSGYDTITAINHLGDKLVVFLTASIVIFDGADFPSGLNIHKTIQGIGCIARDSVQEVGNDLVFMSRDGLRSLVRAIAEDDYPLRDLSAAVRTELIADIVADVDAVKSAYHPDEGLYILLTDSDCWVFDFKRVFQDGIPRVTKWDVPTWNSLYSYAGTLYIGQVGEYGTYSGYTEDSAAYRIRYKSKKVDFGSPNLKVLKKSTMVVEGNNGQNVKFLYTWDYGLSERTSDKALPFPPGGGVYGTGTYGTALYGKRINQAEIQVNPGGTGEVLEFGFESTISGTKLAMEQMSHFAKQGRLAR